MPRDSTRFQRYAVCRRGQFVPKSVVGGGLPPGVTRDDLRRLAPDAFMAWLLEWGYFDVDAETGRVTNLLTGRVRTNVYTGQGRYPAVTLGAGGVDRTVSIHRFIAVKVWGVDACKGKHVAHLDGNAQRSVLSNLALKTPREHVKYDF